MEATLNKNENYTWKFVKNLEISWNFVIVENGNPDRMFPFNTGKYLPFLFFFIQGEPTKILHCFITWRVRAGKVSIITASFLHWRSLTSLTKYEWCVEVSVIDTLESAGRGKFKCYYSICSRGKNQ